jgi:hypothetical protein
LASPWGAASSARTGTQAAETLRTSEVETETDAAQARLDRLIGTRIDAINTLFGATPRILTPKPKVIS